MVYTVGIVLLLLAISFVVIAPGGTQGHSASEIGFVSPGVFDFNKLLSFADKPPGTLIALPEWLSSAPPYDLLWITGGAGYYNKLNLWQGGFGADKDIYYEDGNVGIGTPTPGTELEVAGTIKTNALTFAADQSTMSKAPRVIVTTDPHNGCPPARPANQDLFTQTFTLDRAATIFATGDIIRYAGGRHDILLLLDGIEIDRTLTYTSSVQWEDAHLVGTPTPVGVGTHTLSLRAPDADIWGCEGSWGAIKTIIFE
ncbi:MAG: hypothetical protein QF632_02155 [Candidatus Woesearchaeota archaeon]|nr:hypothetical protein [Candidatus Woesearchaeota archaeon]MDP7323543.1 hypothetical protein [Candidatus Woesearchaeota archaeon]